MELLAPAGSKEALVAAIEAGADSVYVGLKEFNARRKAMNFSLYDLEVMCDYVHRMGRKLYLALNILIKEREIPQIFDSLNRIAALPIDGVILQDLGLLYLMKRYFPGIPLHASTQMTAHNSAGVRFLEKEGFKRVILARELSIPEIEEIGKSSRIELEVFVHGALCYSVSGLCFASSFIGGSSGNRGLCTQPCRRRWKAGNREGFPFSTMDLQAIAHLKKLETIGVKAIKIEGRIRSAEYVSRVVEGYRKALDGARGVDIEDFSREKSSYFLKGRSGPVISPSHPGATGKRAGSCTGARDGMIRIRAEEELCIGNRLRVCNIERDETCTFSLKELFVDGKSSSSALPGTECEIPFEGRVDKGSVVYIVRSQSWKESALKKKVDKIYSSYTRKNGSNSAVYHHKVMSDKLSSLLKWKKVKRKTEPLPSVRIDNLKWLQLIRLAEVRDFIIQLDAFNDGEAGLGRFNRISPGHVIIDLPPFIPEKKLAAYRGKIRNFLQKGYERFMAENIAHLEMVQTPQGEIMAGPTLYALNSPALRLFSMLHVSQSVLSFEDEFLNLRDLSHTGGIPRQIIIFAYPACFITRIKPELPEGAVLSGSGVELVAHRSPEITSMVSRIPVSLFQHREKLAASGVSGFIIDLSFTAPSRKFWEELKYCYKTGKAYQPSTKYNFKRGLK